MAISVTVPLDALENPDVARALSQLMLSLGGGEVSGEAPPRRPRRAATNGASQAKASKGSKKVDTSTEEERYQSFISGLPDPSRSFIDLIRKRGRLRLSDAVHELDITRPKTLGGITGSLTRWAKRRDIDLPYRAEKAGDGERVWVWTRTSDAPKTASRGRAKRKSSGSKRSTRSKKKESEAARVVAPPPRPDVTGQELLTDDRYAPLINGMNELSREFLVLLSDQKSLTISDALRAFGLRRAKAIGDVIRAYRARARERKLALPFEEQRGHTGERMWTWRGLYPDSERASSRKPSGKPTGVIVRRSTRGEPPVPATL